MENYYQQAQEYEKKIFQLYVDKCKPFYGKFMINATFSFSYRSNCLNNKSRLSAGSILCWLAMTGISVIFTPLFSSQSFPSEAEYPFDMESQPLKTIIYAHHILIAYQSVIQVSTNTFPALLLWFVAARFDILSVQFRTMTNIKELMKYTHEHRLLLR